MSQIKIPEIAARTKVKAITCQPCSRPFPSNVSGTISLMCIMYAGPFVFKTGMKQLSSVLSFIIGKYTVLFVFVFAIEVKLGKFDIGSLYRIFIPVRFERLFRTFGNIPGSKMNVIINKNDNKLQYVASVGSA
jgi:hypothetical protein